MKIKKLFSVLILFVMIQLVVPINAFGAKKPITDENTIIEYINLDWWKDLDDPILLEYIIKSNKNNQF